MKMPDLNAASLESAMSMIAGTARSMGICRRLKLINWEQSGSEPSAPKTKVLR